MENRFIKSLQSKLKTIDFDSTYFEFSDIVIPIPNMLVDDKDPLVDIVEDEEVRREAKKFLKLAGYINRQEEINIQVKLENTKEKTTKGTITLINVVFKVNKDFNYNELESIMG